MPQPESISRFPALLAMLIALGASTFFACRSSSPARGAAAVTAHTLTALAVVEVRLTVQSPSVLSSPLKVVLAAKGDQFSSVLTNLAVAADYVFTAEAFGAGGKLVAHGMAAEVVISNGHTTTVIIYLNEINRPSPFHNSSPLIDAITLSASSVTPGGQIAVGATAHDPDAGQTATLVFSWAPATACGAISDVNTGPGTDAVHPSESKVTWTAPQADEKCSIILVVKDSFGLANSAVFAISVTSNPGGVGSASVSAVFNGAPIISVLTAAPAQIFMDGPTSGVMAALATDPENDTLSYSWTVPSDSPCTVQFATPTEASTLFTVRSAAAGVTACTFLVAVSDGYWPGTSFVRNVSTAGLTLAVTPPVVVQVPPIFGIAYQSRDIATAGSPVTFAAIASDPAGGNLNFAWSASSGSAPVAGDPVSLGLDPAFATAATWTVPDGEPDAGSDLVVTVTATSPLSNLQSSFNFCLGAECGRPQGGDAGGP
jgi:hypothetical protein